MKLLLKLIGDELETFLENWTSHMESAGYLEHTTAKRDDCIRSIEGVINPIQQHLDTGVNLGFADILQNRRDIAEFVLMSARKHKSRGITAEMYFGCFKTLIHSIEDIIVEADMSETDKLKGYIALRRVIDAMETVAVGDWDSLSNDADTEILAAKNRSLTLEKNKYENIFESTSDIVLVINNSGTLLEMNASAGARFGREILGGKLLSHLGFADHSVESFIKNFPHGHKYEIRLPDDNVTYSMVLVPLKKVSLASAGYVIILNDISNIAEQRQRLEQLVSQRTAALRNSENLFRSLFSSAGEGIILIDDSLQIVQANEKAADMFGLDSGRLEGSSCVRIIHPDSIDNLRRASSIAQDEVWHGEINGITVSGDSFPASITVNKFQLGDASFMLLIVRNITQQKAMERYLHQEKTKAEEMNVTLRNVMKAIDNEKAEFELSISQKITTSIIPSLQKLASEENDEIRDMYMKILRNQLAGLTKSSGSINSEVMVRLTKSELHVCQMIQSGDSSKDIAEAMHISIETVQTHRKNIRRKLGLSGKDVNLFAYLNK